MVSMYPWHHFKPKRSLGTDFLAAKAEKFGARRVNPVAKQVGVGA